MLINGVFADAIFIKLLLNYPFLCTKKRDLTCFIAISMVFLQMSLVKGSKFRKHKNYHDSEAVDVTFVPDKDNIVNFDSDKNVPLASLTMSTADNQLKLPMLQEPERESGGKSIYESGESEYTEDDDDYNSGKKEISDCIRHYHR